MQCNLIHRVWGLGQGHLWERAYFCLLHYGTFGLESMFGVKGPTWQDPVVRKWYVPITLTVNS